MSAGFKVSRDLLDARAGEVARDLQRVLTRAEQVHLWLVDQPVVDGADPLVVDLGYTEDEAYLLRSTFTDLTGLANAETSVLVRTRKLAGLE